MGSRMETIMVWNSEMEFCQLMCGKVAVNVYVVGISQMELRTNCDVVLVSGEVCSGKVEIGELGQT